MNNNCLSEKLLFTVVRLEGQTPVGTSIGTGFLYKYKNRLFLVTNKHVINDVTHGIYTITKLDTTSKTYDPLIGQGISFNFRNTDFIGHPDPNIDVTVSNISEKVNFTNDSGNPIFYFTIEDDIIPTDEQVEKFISPLEEIIFIGYPSGIWDSTNLLPIIRKGITATPYYYDFLGEKKFLIDASVFPGSSGSPVFLYYSGGYPDKEGNLYAGNRVFFLGIVAQTYHKEEEGEIKIRSIPTKEIPMAVSRQMIDLGIVFKSSTIIDTMERYLMIADKT
jgi:hypothetical protein